MHAPQEPQPWRVVAVSHDRTKEAHEASRCTRRRGPNPGGSKPLPTTARRRPTRPDDAVEAVDHDRTKDAHEAS